MIKLEQSVVNTPSHNPTTRVYTPAERDLISSYLNLNNRFEDYSSCETCNNCGSGNCASCCSSPDD